MNSYKKNITKKGIEKGIQEMLENNASIARIRDFLELLSINGKISQKDYTDILDNYIFQNWISYATRYLWWA